MNKLKRRRAKTAVLNEQTNETLIKDTKISNTQFFFIFIFRRKR